MKVLVDTHALLWFAEDDPHLSPAARKALEDDANQVVISVATVWEMAIKCSVGKLELADGYQIWTQRHILGRAFQILETRVEHFFEVHNLPWIHRDPFDRLIAAQARVETLTLVSHDENLGKYPGVQVLW
jgi:PIN domain nuclease of toxin-antitoxin system